MTAPRFSFFSTSLPNIEGPFSWEILRNDERFKYLRHFFDLFNDFKLI